MKIGLIGCGKWGQNYARVLSKIDCRFVGIADPLCQTKKIADMYDVKYFKNYTDLLPHVDAVSIVTPTNTHYQIAKDCLLKKKNVLVEKPFVLSSKEAKKLIDIAAEKNLILAVGHLFRFNPAVSKIKHVLQKIGDINYITMRYIHSHNPPRKDCGVILNFGTHLFDILNFIVNVKPKKIFCKKINYLSNEREDCALILLDYEKFNAFLELSWFHPLKERDAWIIASREKIYADLLNQKMKRYKIKVGFNKTTDSGFIDEKIKFKEPLKEELKHFCHCVEYNKEPINNGMSGYMATRLCEAAIKSSMEGKEVSL